MFSRENILDLKQLYQILFRNKYLILVFMLISVLSTNIYVQKFKNKVQLEKTFIIKKDIESLLGKRIIKKKIVRFLRKNNKYLGGKYGYYNYKGRYILKAQFFGLNTLETNANMEKFTELFENEVINDFVIMAKQNLDDIKSKALPITLEINEYSQNMKKFDLLILKEIKNETSDNIYKFEMIRQLLVKKVKKLKNQNKSLLIKFNTYKEITDLNNTNLFHTKQTEYLYEVNKISFFIFSVIFSFIMSTILVVLFFNKAKY